MQTLDTGGFAPAATPPPLAADEVHLWLLATDRAGAQVRLRELLGAYLGLAADALPLACAAHGKPYLAGPAGWLGFNLSHSGQHALIALGRGLELGVDLECSRRERPVAALARRYFRADEAARLERLPATRQQRAFLALWTCKEAVLKAIGRGLAFGLDRLGFALDADGMPLALDWLDGPHGPPAAWQVMRLGSGDGCPAALAWRGPPRRVCGFRHA